MRFHLFPFRTEKLSSLTPMVLRFSRGRVGSRLFKVDPLSGRPFFMLGIDRRPGFFVSRLPLSRSTFFCGLSSGLSSMAMSMSYRIDPIGCPKQSGFVDRQHGNTFSCRFDVFKAVCRPRDKYFFEVENRIICDMASVER